MIDDRGHLPLLETTDWTLERLEAFCTHGRAARPELQRAMTSRLALVTGAASGIGRSIAAHFLEEGLRVVGLDIRPPSPFDTDRWTGLSCDVSDEQAWAKAMRRIVPDLGAPDVLVNAAGSSGRSQQEPASARAWAEILRTNLISCWLGMRVVLPHMTARRSGSIVNIGALTAQQPFPLPDLGGYAASKAGIEAITRSTALEVASAGIAVNCVAPGPIETPMAATMPPAARVDILARVPMRRMGTPEEVAALVGFLASERCGFVTGQVIYIDGGLSVGVLNGAILRAGGATLRRRVRLAVDDASPRARRPIHSEGRQEPHERAQ